MNIQKLFVDPPSTRKVLEEISDLPDHLIPKSLFGWKSEFIRFLKKNPFDQNVFIMVRYGAESEKVLKWVKDAVESYPSEQKFSAIVAKDVDLIDDLNNPIACLLCCRYGIAIFDSVSTKAEINPNVAYEIGFMHLLQRKTLILKESKLTSLPSDILHKLYQPYSTEADVQKIVNEWLKKINPT